MTMKNIKKTKLPHITKGLIGNYHYWLNIEHAKSLLENGLIVNSLLGDIPTATKQAAGREGNGFCRLPCTCIQVKFKGLLVRVSKSNLNNLERALKKFKVLFGF